MVIKKFKGDFIIYLGMKRINKIQETRNGGNKS